MNLVLRLIWMLIAARFGSRRDVMGVSHLTFRCMPTDLDINMHMTNSRYHSFMDLSRIDFMIRNGAWKRLRDAKLYPVLGSSSIRFRRPIAPLQKFDVTTRILSWDERWIYIEHKVVAAGQTAAIAVVKTTFLSPQGRVPTEQLIAIMGYTGPKPDYTALVQKKDELDAMLKA
jgi:acyl-CoA thioesterase FadM